MKWHTKGFLMTFNDLLNLSKTNPKYAFFVGMIYGWPLVKNNHIFATITYKTGTRINETFSNDELRIINTQNLTAVTQFISRTQIQHGDISTNAVGNTIFIAFSGAEELDSGTESGRAFIYGMIEKVLIDYNQSSKNAFISGMFNGRGSLDFSRKWMAIDLESKKYPNLTRRKYMTLCNLTGIFYNFNPRILQVHSNQKNDQFRIPLAMFVSEYGLFLPFKIKYYERVSGNRLVMEDDLYYKKYDLSRIPEYGSYQRALQLNRIAQDFVNKDITEDELFRKRAELGLPNDGSIDAILNANPNVKELRKVMSNYSCEINHAHPTFIAKSNGQRFVEGHHLIPFHKRNEFRVNIDVVENIVALCPVCHRQIHLGQDAERQDMLSELYDRNIDGLRSAGISITKETLISLYV